MITTPKSHQNAHTPEKMSLCWFSHSSQLIDAIVGNAVVVILSVVVVVASGNAAVIVVSAAELVKMINDAIIANARERIVVLSD